MFEIREQHPPELAHVEFDYYVPVTIEWLEYYRLLDTPLYLRHSDDSRQFLELKLHPSSHQLVSIVLVTTPEIRRVLGTLAVSTTDPDAMAFWTGPTGEHAISLEPARVTAYDDCLVIALTPQEPNEWTGSEPVLFGLSDSLEVVALRVSWTSTDRELLLTYPGRSIT